MMLAFRSCRQGIDRQMRDLQWLTSPVRLAKSHRSEGPLRREAGHTFLTKEVALSKRLLCPSAPADVKAILLGVVQPDGSVAFMKDRIEVTREFLDIATKGRAPETRFRFSSACRGSACKQWANGGCSLPKRLADMVPRTDATDAPLPGCSIRAQCRWFYQRGSDACRICPVVVTRGDSTRARR
jgi:hypothetical protein